MMGAVFLRLPKKFEIVGGDAHIAPAVKVHFMEKLRRIRDISERADVGIGPYDKFSGRHKTHRL